MSEYVFKLPDLGEGTVEAEIVEWHVKPGDVVREGDVICDVMTDKANVEVPAPVDGKVLRTTGEPGDVVAVGSELIALETAGKAAARPRAPDRQPDADTRSGEAPAAKGAAAKGAAAKRAAAKKVAAEQAPAADEAPAAEQAPAADKAPAAEQAPAADKAPAAAVVATATEPTPPAGAEASGDRGKVIASPAIRRRAKEAGIDLAGVPGSGPRGRILRRDLEAALTGAAAPQGTAGPVGGERAASEFEETKVIGVRRVIAERMSQSKREIPHFAYVEEVDVSELEALRRHLNDAHQRRLTVLPFIGVALIRALADVPQCNARYDGERGMLQTFRPVHLGIATQTPDGLKVPVVRDAQRLSLWRLAAEIARVAEGAREGKAGRGELSGSTITITSLGRMGGVVTTPVINHPEVSIIGVNKAVERPVVIDGQVRVRTVMNLSSSFDHRFVDGFDAAAMIQRVKALLEHPATLFLNAPD